MIFKSGYRRFVMSKQIKSGGLDFFKSFLWAVISTILTIAAYYGSLLLTRENSDTVPMFFYTSYFGLLYIYTVANFIVIFIVLITNINFIRFPEIANNRWNLLMSMGVPISGLVGSKIASSIFALVREYLLGYLMVIGCGYFFKMPFSINFLLALFFIGVISLILLMMIAMTVTVLLKRNSASRVHLFLSFIAVQAILVYFEFYHDEMFRVEVLIKMFALTIPSFMTFSAMLYVLCYVIILFAARSRSRRQELMPLGLFDIKPLVSGSETELFMNDGMKNTTILDTGILKEEELPRATVVEKPDMYPQDEQAVFPYGLFIFSSAFFFIAFGFLLLVSAVFPQWMTIAERIFGEGMAAGLATSGGIIVLGVLSAVFLFLFIILLVLNKRSRNTARL